MKNLRVVFFDDFPRAFDWFHEPCTRNVRKTNSRAEFRWRENGATYKKFCTRIRRQGGEGGRGKMEEKTDVPSFLAR